MGTEDTLTQMTKGATEQNAERERYENITQGIIPRKIVLEMKHYRNASLRTCCFT